MTGSADTVVAELEDRDVIRRARAGSLPAYDEVMRRYERRVLGFLLRRCSCRQDAEDLVQETFLRAWQRLHLYDERWAFSTWILTVAARLCATHHRRRSERPGATIGDRASPVALPDESAAQSEEGRNVWRLADRILTEEQRVALWLRYADDMPIKDIGRVLGKSAVATRVMLFRARAALASHMHEHTGEALSPGEHAGAGKPIDVVTRRTPAHRAGLALSTNSGGS